MARMLGAGAADKAGEAILKRKVKMDEMTEASASKAKLTEEKASKGAQSQPSLPAQKVKDASSGAYKDYQMQQAIEEVRKKKTASRSAY